MTRRDHVIVSSLVLLLAMIATSIAAPAFWPTPGASPLPSGYPTSAARPYREGVVGQVESVNPLAAASRPEQDLVSLVFSGLVALGPDGGLVPGLASDWQADATGKVWTFHIRRDARWHDGQAVTAHDVAFTVGVLRDPDYRGPAAASWREVTVSEVDERTVRFTLETPLGGFLQAAVQPIVPAHLLEGVPIRQLATDPFGRHPVGSGPFRLVSLDDRRAVLAPADAPGPSAPASPVAPPSGRGFLPRPTPSGEVPRPRSYLAGIELRLFDDGPSLAAAWTAGELDAASGLPPAEATRLAGLPGSRLLRYPTTTLTMVVFNLRMSRPEFRDARARVALLRATDRDAIVTGPLAAAATRADSPIPPSSWAFDPRVSPALGFDATAAREGLTAAGWTFADGAWTAPDRRRPIAFQLLSPDVGSNPAAFSAAAAIAADWREFGFAVTHVGMPPTELVSRHLRTANFIAAAVDVNIGLDPDLYPLLASTQTTSQGLNVAGLQDPELDKRLAAARAPGPTDARQAAYTALQQLLASRQYVLPIAFRDELVVARDDLLGVEPRLISSGGDRYWDVLTWRLADDR